MLRSRCGPILERLEIPKKVVEKSIFRGYRRPSSGITRSNLDIIPTDRHATTFNYSGIKYKFEGSVVKEHNETLSPQSFEIQMLLMYAVHNSSRQAFEKLMVFSMENPDIINEQQESKLLELVAKNKHYHLHLLEFLKKCPESGRKNNYHIQMYLVHHQYEPILEIIQSSITQNFKLNAKLINLVLFHLISIGEVSVSRELIRAFYSNSYLKVSTPILSMYIAKALETRDLKSCEYIIKRLYFGKYIYLNDSTLIQLSQSLISDRGAKMAKNLLVHYMKHQYITGESDRTVVELSLNAIESAAINYDAEFLMSEFKHIYESYLQPAIARTGYVIGVNDLSRFQGFTKKFIAENGLDLSGVLNFMQLHKWNPFLTNTIIACYIQERKYNDVVAFVEASLNSAAIKLDNESMKYLMRAAEISENSNFAFQLMKMKTDVVPELKLDEAIYLKFFKIALNSDLYHRIFDYVKLYIDDGYVLRGDIYNALKKRCDEDDLDSYRMFEANVSN